MTVEVLFPEVCNLYGDSQNAVYLRRSLPEAEFIDTPLFAEPYFANNEPDIVYIGAMSEKTQRRAIEKLLPLKARIEALLDRGTVFLATANAGEIFYKSINYVTEKIETPALGFFDLTVTTDYFHRVNGKVLGAFEGMELVGFQSQFSMTHGDMSKTAFLNVSRGNVATDDPHFEGARYKTLFCTSLLGPVLPVNPLFTEYILRLAGSDAPAAFREQAVAAYEQRLKEFRDPETVF